MEGPHLPVELELGCPPYSQQANGDPVGRAPHTPVQKGSLPLLGASDSTRWVEEPHQASDTVRNSQV
ncbi:hypothetical protein THAOC_32024 [Thalassiosira oceanica]|uniref:Uncharacterized protein n=1 Tax=Thalassiosira oceanica TaxID=159749 RepID=K0R6W7_THAOC|nr:hypothetical protein THAOC_32024 [Thalassiosira oceanica]|eukprot:EJK49128.1 hypothetical protein THAOC_32024 [Thalassiosira oceanica]